MSPYVFWTVINSSLTQTEVVTPRRSVPSIVQIDFTHTSQFQLLKNLGLQARTTFGSLPDLIIVVLPVSAESIQKHVKQFGNIEFGVATQCLVHDCRAYFYSTLKTAGGQV
jgi:hypothetical protein